MASSNGESYSSSMAELRDMMTKIDAKMESCHDALEKEKKENEKEIAKQREELKAEREAFEREKAKMADIKAKQSDIIELNVGGRPFSTTRATLCAQPDTLLASMFSGRWEGSMQRDRNGAVFLDFNPDLFALLLDHLRSLPLSPGGSKPLPKPASPELEATWATMLTFFGFLEPPVPHDTSCLCTFADELSSAEFTFTNDGHAAVRKTGTTWATVVVGGAVGKGALLTWKMRVINPNTERHLIVGFVDDRDTESVRAMSNYSKCTGFALEGQFVSKNVWDTTVAFGRMVANSAEIEIQLDTRDTNAPTVQFKSHSQHKMPLPREWERVRFVVLAQSGGRGCEILSVQ